MANNEQLKLGSKELPEELAWEIYTFDQQATFVEEIITHSPKQKVYKALLRTSRSRHRRAVCMHWHVLILLEGDAKQGREAKGFTRLCVQARLDEGWLHQPEPLLPQVSCLH